MWCGDGLGAERVLEGGSFVVYACSAWAGVCFEAKSGVEGQSWRPVELQVEALSYVTRQVIVNYSGM